jgi:hypothetical protein
MDMTVKWLVQPAVVIYQGAGTISDSSADNAGQDACCHARELIDGIIAQAPPIDWEADAAVCRMIEDRIRQRTLSPIVGDQV